MANNRIGGTLTFTMGSTQLEAKGDFSTSGYFPIREGVAGLDGVHGYTEKPQVPMIEGTITTGQGFNLEDIQTANDLTITLEKANGTVYVLFEAWETAEGADNADEGSLPVKFQGMRGEQTG